MGLAGKFLRNLEDGFAHWCPGCEEMHFIPTDPEDSPCWSFNGNLESPTFNPSVRIGGKQTVKVNGQWTGEWVRDEQGNALDRICHYFIRDGKIEYCSDSTHALSGQTIPLSEVDTFPF